jgi:hypothetical protein
MKSTLEQRKLVESKNESLHAVILDYAEDKPSMQAWISRVSEWPIGEKPKFIYGSKIDCNRSEVGARTGDIVYYGRKHRKPKWSVAGQYAIIDEDGERINVTPVQAMELFRLKNSVNVGAMKS